MTAGPAIRVEALRKRFGDVVALDGLDLVAPEGEVLALLGPNGAGKTTLVRALATLLVPDSGRAIVLGRDVVADPFGVRREIGLAGQFAAVDEILTGRENLEMVGMLYHLGRRESARRAIEVLERFGLTDAADRRTSTYSGGMRRRLDLAATLVGRPRVLFLDEPTTGLDPRSRAQLWKMVRELRSEGTTILLTTQYLEEADQLAQLIAVIDQGRIVAEGTAHELKERVGADRLIVRVFDPANSAVAREALSVLVPEGRSAGGRRRRAVAPDLGAGRVGGRRPRARPGRRRDRRPRDPLADARRRVPLTHRPARGAEVGGSAGGGGRMNQPTFRYAVSDSLVMARRGLLESARKPALLVFTFIEPVILIVIFRYAFGGAIRVPNGDYVNFLMPGILVLTAIFGTIVTGIGFSEDLSKGIIDRLRSLPIARSAVLVGRTLSDLARNVGTVAITFAVGLIVGFDPTQPIYEVLAAIVAAARVRLRVLVDLGDDRPARARSRNRAGRRLRLGVPAHVRELGVRPDPDDAGGRARVRGGQSGDAVRERRPGADDRRRRRRPGARNARLAGRAADRVRAVRGVALPGAGVGGRATPGAPRSG